MRSCYRMSAFERIRLRYRVWKIRALMWVLRRMRESNERDKP
jgi:hypothetical protein